MRDLAFTYACWVNEVNSLHLSAKNNVSSVIKIYAEINVGHKEGC